MDDQKVRKSLEQLSNGISRRRFLDVGVKGIFGALAAIATGQFGLRSAFATHYYCCDEGTSECGGCPSVTQTSQKCPSGLSICTTSSGCAYCKWSTGEWNCGIGPIYRCVDCWNGSSCASACTCAQQIHCCE